MATIERTQSSAVSALCEHELTPHTRLLTATAVRRPAARRVPLIRSSRHDARLTSSSPPLPATQAAPRDGILEQFAGWVGTTAKPMPMPLRATNQQQLVQYLPLQSEQPLPTQRAAPHGTASTNAALLASQVRSHLHVPVGTPRHPTRRIPPCRDDTGDSGVLFARKCPATVRSCGVAAEKPHPSSASAAEPRTECLHP